MSRIDLDLINDAYLRRALAYMGAGFPEDFEQLAEHPDLLSLQDSFNSCAGDLGQIQSLLSELQSGGIPASMMMPPPNMACCPCAGNYAETSSLYGEGKTAEVDMNQMFSSGRNAKMFEMLLARDPFLRGQVEMMLGGQFIEDETNDGKFKVQPFMGGSFSGNINPTTLPALAALAQVQQAAMSAGLLPGVNATQDEMFMGMILGGLAQTYGGEASAFSSANGLGGGGGWGGGGGGIPRLPGGGSPFVDWADRPYQFQPGMNGPFQGNFGISPGGGDEVSAVLNDPSLTVEDKVCLMIMLIMKKMDKDIEKQAQYINSLQQQQSGGAGAPGGGAPGGPGGQPGGGSSPSIDVETMKLKRLIDKRSQMFDMLRQIIDKYNQTAKGIIDSMGR